MGWAPTFGGRIGFPPPENYELVLSILKKGVCRYCTDSTKTKHPVLNLAPSDTVFYPQILELRLWAQHRPPHCKRDGRGHAYGGLGLREPPGLSGVTRVVA